MPLNHVPTLIRARPKTIRKQKKYVSHSMQHLTATNRSHMVYPHYERTTLRRLFPERPNMMNDQKPRLARHASQSSAGMAAGLSDLLLKNRGKRPTKSPRMMEGGLVAGELSAKRTSTRRRNRKMTHVTKLTKLTPLCVCRPNRVFSNRTSSLVLVVYGGSHGESLEVRVCTRCNTHTHALHAHRETC